MLDLTIHNGLRGLKIVAELSEIDSTMRLIVTSGYAADKAITNYIAFGLHGALPKPFSLADLKQTIAQAMSCE